MKKRKKLPLKYDYSTLLFENSRQSFQNKQKRHLPWFATMGAVIILTLFCGIYDGFNLYTSFSGGVRDNFIITCIAAVGATVMLNFSMTILAHMLKSYIQKQDEIKMWMLIVFFVIISLFFASIFVYRYSVPEAPFVSKMQGASLGGNSMSINSNTSKLTMYAFATIINLSSVASSAICFFIGYYNSNPKELHWLADAEFEIDLKEQYAYMLGCEAELDSVNESDLNEYENKRFEASNDQINSEALVHKMVFRNQLEQQAGTPSKISAISENAQDIVNQHFDNN